MADDRGPTQMLRIDVGGKLVGNRFEQIAVGVGARWRAGESVDLHQMHAVIVVELRGFRFHVARGAKTGNEDHVLPSAARFDREACRLRLRLRAPG